jgi:hypothetical protein
MTTTPATRADALRQQMAALTASQSTETLTAAWMDAAGQQATATTDGQRRTLAIALDSMTTELHRRGVSQDTLDTALWAVRMQATS